MVAELLPWRLHGGHGRRPALHAIVPQGVSPSWWSRKMGRGSSLPIGGPSTVLPISSGGGFERKHKPSLGIGLSGGRAGIGQIEMLCNQNDSIPGSLGAGDSAQVGTRPPSGTVGLSPRSTFLTGGLGIRHHGRVRNRGDLLDCLTRYKTCLKSPNQAVNPPPAQESKP